MIDMENVFRRLRAVAILFPVPFSANRCGRSDGLVLAFIASFLNFDAKNDD